MAQLDLTPIAFDFKIKKGDTFICSLRHTLEGSNVDMTAVTATMKFSGDIPSLTLGNGLSWGTGATAHILYINTDYLFPARCKYELKYVYPSGRKRTPIEGFVINEAQL